MPVNLPMQTRNFSKPLLEENYPGWQCELFSRRKRDKKGRPEVKYTINKGKNLWTRTQVI